MAEQGRANFCSRGGPQGAVENRLCRAQVQRSSSGDQSLQLGVLRHGLFQDRDVGIDGTVSPSFSSFSRSRILIEPDFTQLRQIRESATNDIRFMAGAAGQPRDTLLDRGSRRA